MIRFPILIAALLAALPAQATALFQFCWIGGAGYTMTGRIGFPSALLGTGVITEAEITYFEITGFHDGLPVGQWSLEQLSPETSWTLRFDTRSLAFPMGGLLALGTYQAWNANGQVDDCGKGGFGFNGGNWAQDVCIDNSFIEASSIDPETPLQAVPAGTDLVCEAVRPMM